MSDIVLKVENISKLYRLGEVGTGTISLSATTTLQSKNAATDLANQYGAATVYHRGSNVWIAIGDLS